MLSKLLRTGAVFGAAIAERRVPYLPVSRLREIQNRRLQDAMRHAYETVPFYREVMLEKRLKPEDFRSVDDLARLPLIDRSFVQQNPTAFRSAQFPDAICTAFESGGGTTTFWDPAAFARRLPLAERDRVIWLKMTAGYGRKRQLYILAGSSASITARRFYDGQFLTPRFLVERFYTDPKEPFDVVAERIERVRPDVVFSYGSYLEQYSRYLRNLHRRSGMPKLWVYGADTLTESWRQVVQNEMGCRVLANYSSTECGRIGFECEHQAGYHLNIDYLPVRIVRDDGSHCEDGEVGQVVVSNLLNRATVLLNYLQGDLAECTSETCRCGRTLPRLIRLHGRVSDVVVMADGQKLTATVLLGHLAQELQSALQIQIQSVSPGRVLFRISPSAETDQTAFTQRLLSRFHEVYGDRAKAEVQFAAEIPRLPRGKFEIVAGRKASE